MAGEILIDTSTLIDFLQGSADEETKQRLLTSEVAISSITFGELYKFTLKTGKTHLWPIYKQKLYNWNIFDATKEITEKAAGLSHMHGLSFADSIIYATALLNDLELLTSDAKDFKGKKGVIISGRK